MNWQVLLDPVAATIVLGGTLLATLLRCGPTDSALALRQLSKTGTAAFDYEASRARIARQIEIIHREGILRAPDADTGDEELQTAGDALIRHRSIPAMLETHRRQRAKRRAVRARALRALDSAGDLAPVFGLAGTLFALSQLPVNGTAGDGALMAAIAQAVATTLYGVLAAHLLFYPLARLVERRAQAEDDARARLIEWLANQVESALKLPARPDPAKSWQRAA